MPSRQSTFKAAVVIALLLTIILQYFYFQETRRSVPKLKDRSQSLFTFDKLAVRLKVTPESPAEKAEIKLHEEYASNFNQTDHSDIATANEVSCVNMRQLLGHVETLLDAPSVDDIAKLHPDVAFGGHFTPNCSHKDKVAIIVPFRDRLKHLEIFLYNIHPILKRQLIEYNIFIVEQTGSDLFNRAMLFNVGYTESMKIDNFTCFIFHDVDLVPENDHNIYSCPITPRHMSVAVSTMKYKLPYRTIFGGISALRKEDFVAVNGFSNRYWGWGAEDDDMANRIAYHGLYISRYPPTIGRYKMLKHKHQKVNFNRYRILQKGKTRFSVDGLSSLNYTVEQIVLHKLYTLMKVHLVKT